MEVSLTLDQILALKKVGVDELHARRQKQGARLARWVEQTPDAIEQGLSDGIRASIGFHTTLDDEDPSAGFGLAQGIER